MYKPDLQPPLVCKEPWDFLNCASLAVWNQLQAMNEMPGAQAALGPTVGSLFAEVDPAIIATTNAASAQLLILVSDFVPKVGRIWYPVRIIAAC